MSQPKITTTSNGRHPSHPTAPDPEVPVRAQRRQFTVADKLRILAEADACCEPGQIGALLRREGIYSSYLSDWRRERENGQLQGLGGQSRGRPRTAPTAEVAQLQRENGQLKAQLAQAELIIAAQKKLSQALEQTLSLSKERDS